MKRSQLRLYRFTLPLKSPIRLSRYEVKNLKGVLLRLKHPEFEEIYGEATPLPGLHRETPEQIITEAKSIIREMDKAGLPEQAIGGLPDSIDEMNSLLKFAFSSIFWQYELYKQGKNLFSGLPDPPAEISLNGLITDPEKYIQEAEKGNATLPYFRTLKVKTGRLDPMYEVDLIWQLTEILPEETRIRLDPNRSWNFDTAIEVCQKLPRVRIEYLEDPLSCPERLAELREKTGYAIALDESLGESDPDLKNVPRWADALVIKPSVIGDIEKTKRLIERAGADGQKCVISDSLHGGIGWLIHLALAGFTGDSETAMGLTPYANLQLDYLQAPRISIENRLTLKHFLDTKPEINNLMIEEIGL